MVDSSENPPLGGRGMLNWVVVGLLLVAIAGMAVTFNRQRAAVRAQREAAEIMMAQAQRRLASAPETIVAPAGVPDAQKVGRVESIVFCGRVGHSSIGRLVLHDVFNDLSMKSFPTDLTFWVVVTIRPAEPGHDYRLVFVSPQGETVLDRPIELREGVGLASESVVWIEDLHLTKPSELVFHVMCDGKPLAGRRLKVRTAADAGVTSGSAAK